MPQTHDAGSFFVHVQPHPRGCGTVTVATTHEVEEPFRVGRSLAIRLWPSRRTVVLGRWDRQTATWDIEDPVINERLQAALAPRRKPC